VRTITKPSPNAALIWQEAKRLNAGCGSEDIPCYEAGVKGGKYRAAPVVYIMDEQGNRTYPNIGYEAFFIPDGAKSMADVRDIAEHLTSIDEAKTIAEEDYRKRQTSR
jgi:hypothetical protein